MKKSNILRTTSTPCFRGRPQPTLWRPHNKRGRTGTRGIETHTGERSTAYRRGDVKYKASGPSSVHWTDISNPDSGRGVAGRDVRLCPSSRPPDTVRSGAGSADDGSHRPETTDELRPRRATWVPLITPLARWNGTRTCSPTPAPFSRRPGRRRPARPRHGSGSTTTCLPRSVSRHVVYLRSALSANRRLHSQPVAALAAGHLTNVSYLPGSDTDDRTHPSSDRPGKESSWNLWQWSSPGRPWKPRRTRRAWHDGSTCNLDAITQC